jgi:hypothetical protein
VKRLERYLNTFTTLHENVVAIGFGDFNNRLVFPKWLTEHVSFKGEGKFKEPVLLNTGAQMLCSRLNSKKERLELMRTLDSNYFKGEDASGRIVEVPEACERMQNLFSLHSDHVLADSSRVLPLPTYKRQPVDNLLSDAIGFKLEIPQLITQAQVEEGVELLKKNRPILQADLRARFCEGLDYMEVDVPAVSNAEIAAGPPTLSFGWPDGCGVYRKSIGVRVTLERWSPCETLTGDFKHEPTRATFHITSGPPVGKTTQLWHTLQPQSSINNKPPNKEAKSWSRGTQDDPKPRPRNSLISTSTNSKCMINGSSAGLDGNVRNSKGSAGSPREPSKINGNGAGRNGVKRSSKGSVGGRATMVSNPIQSSMDKE